MTAKKPKAPRPPIASKRTPSSRVNTSSTENRSKWIRIERPFSLPGYVKDALQRLDEAGHVAYVVGGSVRDFFLSRPSKDHDIATSADPDELCRLFPGAVTVGKAFGVIKIPYPDIAGSPLLEIATFREDLEYGDHRHPKGVRFGGPAEDARRRDFTINGLFFDPKTSRILDTVGGMDDLHAGIVRAIGDASERFREDALRLLRGVRFATTLGFTLDPDTGAAILARAKLITKISAERVRDELSAMWTGPRPECALMLLSEAGLLKQVLPEVEALRALPSSKDEEAWRHCLKVVEVLARQSPKRSPELSWAAVLLDVGKPASAQRNRGKNYNGHDLDSAKLARAIGARLRMPRAQVEGIVAIVENHLKFREVFQMREATLERFVRQENFGEMLALHRADAIASDGNLAYFEFCSGRYALSRESPMGSPRLIDGTDLIQLGFHPGPEFSEILRAVDDLALERKLQSKEEALEFVVKHFVR